MSSYLIKTFALTTTPQVVVAADADVDRSVLLAWSGSAVVIGFNDSDGAILVQGQNDKFVLPAGQDLHAWSNGTSSLGVTATKTLE